ncbi:hypothetical protein [Carboxylicivirga sp. N1Y90]|uniref:hypothetical protein n=1 Tax=Carboxylicivirga fragile TaxID=3417571 RepID=UPI003D32A706|nr:hypothetical protein [Marinilabiliaceae bacterium N1Y90]
MTQIHLRYHWAKKYLLSFGFLLLTLSMTAQNVSVSAKLDSTVTYIGGQMDLKIQMSQPNDIQLAFPTFKDTITKSVEIVRVNPIDTLSTENNRFLLEQRYRITSFDSGLHYIPPIVFEEAGKLLDKTLQTDHMSLMVVNPFEEVDPQKGITDIKQPIDTPFLLSEIQKYFPFVILFIFLVVGTTLAIMKYRGRDIPVNIFKKEEPKIPPHVIALNKLDEIKGEKLWQRSLTKQYYSKLTDALRHYIEERFEVSAMEQTSDEILASFKTIDFSDDKSFENLKQILRTADLVKFAKHEPFPDENDMSMINAYFFINQTKIEEIKSLEEEKQNMLDKEAESADNDLRNNNNE